MRINRAIELALPYGDVWGVDEGWSGAAQAYAENHGRELVQAIRAFREYRAEAAVRYRAAFEQAQGDKDKLRKLNGYVLRDGIAVTDMVGVMDKRMTSMSYFFGGVSTMAMEATLNAIDMDSEARGTLWVVESPGGNIMGTSELAQTVARAKARKPILAYVSDLAASAAQWAIAGATEIWANDTAITGNAGVYTVLRDSSKLAQDIGVRVIAVKSGEFKAIGEPGTEITDEMLAEVKSRVMSITKVMAKFISQQRNLDAEKMADVLTGRTYVGAQGIKAGLVDRIGSVDAAFKRLKQLTASAG